MRTRRSILFILSLLALALLAGPFGTRAAQAQEADPPISTGEIEIVGIEPRPEPATQVAPRNTGTIVTPLLVRSDGVLNGELPELPEDALFLAELRGPAFGTPVALSARPNEPFIIPALPLEGRYTVTNIRLVSGGKTLLQAKPDTATIQVIEKVLVSQVTSRPLTAEEIREKGIVVDQTNFQVINFTVAFGLENERIEVQFPMIIPTNFASELPGVPTINFPHMSPAAPPDSILPGLETLVNIPNMEVTGFGLDIPEDDDRPRGLLSPIPGVVIIPGNVAYLNQFFSVILKVSNVAPGYSNLVVKNLQTEIILPGGNDTVPNTGDDPLRMARLGDPPSPQSRTQPVVQAGPDGKLGTSDDILTLGPNQSGDAEFLVEGLKEGTHRIEMKITGILEGLPGGPVPLQGRAVGIVEVRNPTFALTFNHPAIVTAGEAYDFNVTVTNVSDRPANFASLSLLPRSLSGVELASDQVMPIESIPPGDSATVTFKMKSLTTGAVTSSSYASDGIPGRFELRMGVGELGIPMSPNVLVLPPAADSLKTRTPELYRIGIGLLGQAHALGSAPTTPRGLLPMRTSIVYEQASNVAAAGQRVSLGEPLADMARDLALDFMGNNYTRLPERYSAQQQQALLRAEQDYRGFDSLMRQSSRGADFLGQLSNLWDDAIESQGVLEFQGDFAEAAASRPSHLSAIAGDDDGSAPVVLNLTDLNGKRLGIRTVGGAPVQEVPFGAFFSLIDEDPEFSQMAMVAAPVTGTHTVEVLGTDDGSFDLGIVVPEGNNSLRHVQWSDVPVRAGVRGRVTFNVNSATNSYVLMIDTDNDGDEDPVQPSSAELVVDRGPSVIGSVQIYSERKGETGTKYGQVMGVLFDEEISLETSQDLRLNLPEITNYSVDGNAVQGAALQPGGRVVLLGLRDGIGPFIDRSLTVRNVEDRLGHVMEAMAQPRPIEPAANLPSGGTLQGTVRRADGTPVPLARIVLKMVEMDINDDRYLVVITSKNADSDGRYSFDWIREQDAVIEFMDLQTGEGGLAYPRIRHNGHRLEMDLILIGTGTVTGQVFAEDGKTPLAGADIVVINPLKADEAYQVKSDANGAYIVTGVPVGNVSIRAAHVASRSQTVLATTIPTAGSTIVQDLILHPVSDDYPRGNVQGQVFRSDGVTPAVGVPVYSAIGGVDTTNESGRYVIEGLPTGPVTVRAIDQSTFEVGDASTTISANITTTANIIMHGGTGTVEGVVVENDVPLEGITIYGGRAVVKTGADGTFVLNDVPVGIVRLQARDERNPNNIRMIEASANLTHDGETVEVRMEMPLQGVLTGVVRDAAGNTVPNLKVYAYGEGGYNNKTFTNAQGQYRFENVPLSKYTIAAFFPDFSDGNFREGRLVFKDQTLRLDVNFRGRGNVIGTVYDDDAVTPLGARVGLSEWIVKIGRLIPRENPECLPDVYVGEEKVLDLPECENVPVEWKYQNRSRRMNSSVETGTFTFTNVFLGNFMVEAANPFSPQEVSFEGEILTPTQTVSTTLVLQATGVVTGTVYQPDGVTPVGAEVVVEMDAAYISNVRVVTNGQGQFEFPLAPPGGFTLTAEDSTGLVGQINGSVQAGQTTNVNVRLLRRGSVTVTVTGLNGTGQTVPEEGASVQLAEGSFPYRRFTGTTGPNGTITFAGGNAPVEGFFSVQATKQGVTGRTSGRILGITEDLNGHVSVSIHLDNAVGTVTGRFLRSDGVTPIPNAQVSLSAAGRQAFATTGPDGAYLFDGVRVLENGGTTFTLEGFDPATGRRGRESGQLTTPGETVTRNMIQIAQGTVTGSVRWASDGSPVRAAEVHLSSSVGGQFRTTTGVNGTFTIPGVSAGNFNVSVRDTNTGLSRNATGTLSSEGETVTVELEIQTPPRGRVEGYVFTASGAPATTVSVRLYNQNYSSSNVTVDDEGFYTIERVPPGIYTVRATAQNSPDTGLGTAEVEAAGDVGSADIHLLGLGRVVGVVQTSGANPQPVPFVRVDLVRNDSGSALYFTADDQTGSDGTFEFDEVLVGDISLSTVQGSTGLAGSASGVLPGPGETLTLTLTLEDAASVRGRVLRQNGEPAALMALELQLLTTNPPRYRYGSTSNVEPNVGTFRLDNLKLGSYLLRVSDPLGEGIATASFTLNQQGQVVDLGDIVLDTAPPQVVSITPASGAVGVPVGTNIQVRFSEAVDPTTATNANLSVSNARGVVTGTWALNDAGTIATFTRGAGTFGDLEVVSVRVRTGIKDLVGRNLKAQVVSAFTTTDETPPVTSSVSPAAGATGVPLNSVIRVNYSETIVPAEFDDPARAITVTLNGTALLGTVEPILNNRALVFTPDPSDPLLANSTYEVTIQPATDTYGNRQSEGRTYTFETIDVQAPVVQSLAAAPGTTVRVGSTATITAQLQTAPDVAFVEFFVNGVSRHIQQSAPYAFTLPITRDMGSKVTVSARATDLAGNESVAKSLDLVILPNAAPQVSITTPTGGSQVRNGERITVTVQATDDAGLSRLFFQASGAVQTTVTRDVPQETNTSYTTTFFVNVPLNAPPGASIELRASALDTGNATGDAQAVTVLVRDSIAPSVQITAPQNGVKVEPGEMVTVTVRATDNGSVSAISLTGSGAAIFSETREITPSQSPAEVTFLVPVSETARVTDTLVLSARATDTTGNTSQQTSITLGIKDVWPPQVSVTLPNGVTNVAPGETIAVTVSGTDDVSVVNVGLELAGVIEGVQTQLITPPQPNGSRVFQVTIPATVTVEANTELRLTGRASDAVGNLGRSQTVTLPVIVDEVPEVSITAPTAGATIRNGRQLTVTVQTSDDAGVKQVALKATGAVSFNQTQNVSPITNTHTATFVISVPTSAPLGAITLEASAVDTRNQRATAPTVAVQVVDQTPPAAQILSPANGGKVNPGATVQVQVRATDSYGVAAIELTTSGAFTLTQTRPVSPTATTTTQTFNVVVPETAAANVPVVFSARATDGSGNASQVAAITLTVRDVTAPQVTVTLPEGLTSVIQGGTFTVAVTATDNVGVTELGLSTTGAFQVAEVEPVNPAQSPATAEFTIRVPANASANQPFTIFGTAKDAEGHLGNIEGGTLLVELPETLVSGRVTNADGAVSGAEVTITATNGVFTDTADAQGDYEIAGIAAGDLEVVAVDPATGLRAVALGSLEPGDVQAVIDLEIPDAPEVAVTEPISGTTVIEGTNVTVSAIATSTLGVGRLVFTVDGTPVFTDTNETSSFDIVVPEGVESLTLGAVVYDYYDNTSTAEVVVNVVPDSRTTLVGRVVTSGQSGPVPVPGATITTVDDLSTTTGQDGRFSLAGVPTIYGDIQVVIRATFEGKPYQAILIVTPVPGDVTDLQDVEVKLVKFWDGGGNGTSWHDARNWNNDSLPVGSDDVYIPASANVTYSTSFFEINSLTSDGALTLTGGTLSMAKDSVINGAFTFSNGTLTGAGNLTLEGAATWTRGTMSGSGVTTVANTLTVNPPNGWGVVLGQGRTMENRGTVNWADSTGGTSYFYMQHDAVFNNLAEATFEIGLSSKHFVFQSTGSTGALPLFNNQGTFRKVGGGEISLTSTVFFHNAGTIEVAVGALKLADGGNHSGNFVVASGATLEFSGGTHTLTAQSSVSGEGTVLFSNSTSTSTINVAGEYEVGTTRIAGATVNFNSLATSTNTAFSSGTMGGSGTYTAAGPFTWTTGTMEGTGTTIISNTLTLNPAHGWGTTLGRTMENRGTIDWTNSTGGTSYFYMRNGAVFNNLAGATFEVGGSAKHFNHTSGGAGALPLFNNQGTFRKVGSNAIEVNSNFNLVNNGTFDITAGSVEFKHGTTHSGSFLVRSGTTFTFSAGTHTLNEQSSVSGEGTVFFSNSSGTPTINVAGQYQVSNTNIAGGTVNFNSAATSTNTAFSSGTMGGSGTYTAAGPFTWTTGTMVGSGTTIISNTLTLNPAHGWGTELGRTMENRGTVNWTNNTGGTSYFYMRNGAVFNNLAGATFEVGGSAKHFNHTSGGAGALPLFNNQGTFRKVGSNAIEVNSSFNLVNNGTFDITAGSVEFKNSTTHSGNFLVRSGTTFSFSAGTHTLNEQSSLTGEGTVVFGVSSGTPIINVAGQYQVGTTNIAGSKVYFNSPATSTNTTFSSGTMGGSGTYTAAGPFTWTIGTMEGTGTTIISNTLTLNPTSGHSTTLGRTMENRGTVNWTNNTGGTSYFYMRNGAVFNNLAGATFEVGENTKQFSLTNGGAGSAPLFNNLGTLRKIGAGTATMSNSVVFVNSGTVQVQSGTLKIEGMGAHSGTFRGANGSALEFAGGHTLGSSSVISSTGSVNFTGGTTSVQGTYDVRGGTSISGGTTTFTGQVTNVGQNLTVVGTSTTVDFSSGETLTPNLLTLETGTLTGSDNIVAANVHWTRGTLVGTGVTTATQTLTIDTTGSWSATLGRTFNNAGTATWTNTGSAHFYMQNGSVFNNLAGATFEMGDGKRFNHTAGGTGAVPFFNNAGTIRKVSTGSTIFNSAVTFLNTGTVEARSGTFELAGNNSHSGTFTAASGGTLEFSGNNTLTSGSVVNGAGTIRFNGGTTNIQGTYDVVGTTTMNSGKANLTGQILGGGSTVNVSGGEINFTGQMVDTIETLSLTNGTANFSTGTTQTPSTLTLQNGTLTGSDNIQAANMSWRQGTMEGSGTTTVSGALLLNSPTGGGWSISLYRKLILAGTADWTGTGTTTLNMNKDAILTVLPSATFEIGDGKRILANNGGTGSGPRFDNQGTFRKVGGAGSAGFGSGVPLSNSGTVELWSGTLDLGGGGIQNGSFAALDGTTLDFSGGHTLASSSVINSTSAVLFSGGTNNVQGIYNVTGTTTVSGGTTNFSGQLQNVGTSATFSGGTANFTRPFPDTIESLLVNGGTVNFSTGTTLTPATLTLHSGTLTGSDTIEATNMSWRLGTMEGTGTTAVLGTLAFNVPTGGHTVTMNRKLTVAGTTTWTHAGTATLSMNKNAVFTVLPSATFDVSEGKNVSQSNSGTGSGPLFVNQGTFRKVGAGTFTVGSSVAISNTGTIELQSGTLNLGGGGTLNGTIIGRDGTTLDFSTGHTLASGSVISSTSAVRFTGGTNNVQGSYNVAGSTTISGGTANFTGELVNVGGTVTVSGGSTTANFSSSETVRPATLVLDGGGALSGTDAIEATNMTWITGSMLGGSAATTTVNNLNLNTPNTGNHTLILGRTLNVVGMATWTNEGAAGLNLRKDGIINNQPGAIFEVATNKTFGSTNAGTGTPLFDNMGTFRVAAGTGSVAFANGLPLRNSGEVQVRAGKLVIGNSGYTQLATGTLVIDKTSGSTPGTELHRVEVSGLATLAGTLRVIMADGYDPGFNTTFTVLTYTTRSGQFSAIQGANLPAGQALESTYNSNNLTLTVVSATDEGPGTEEHSFIYLPLVNSNR